jgi:hypothetical protein
MGLATGTARGVRLDVCGAVHAVADRVPSIRVDDHVVVGQIGHPGLQTGEPSTCRSPVPAGSRRRSSHQPGERLLEAPVACQSSTGEEAHDLTAQGDGTPIQPTIRWALRLAVWAARRYDLHAPRDLESVSAGVLFGQPEQLIPRPSRVDRELSGRGWPVGTRRPALRTSSDSRAPTRRSDGPLAKS